MRKLSSLPLLVLLVGAAAPLGGASAPPGPPTSVARETQAGFMTRCRADYAAKYPGAQGAQASCEEGWTRVVAAGPAVDAILGLAGQGPDVTAARARVVGARWNAAPPRGALAFGRLGSWEVSLNGRGGADEAVFTWSAVGELPPFDVPEALKVRGARVTEVACQGFGAGESSRVYRVDMAGRAPFGLTVYDRTAPTANASSTYGVSLALRAAAPTLAGLRSGPNGSEWQARCG